MQASPPLNPCRRWAWLCASSVFEAVRVPRSIGLTIDNKQRPDILRGFVCVSIEPGDCAYNLRVPLDLSTVFSPHGEKNTMVKRGPAFGQDAPKHRVETNLLSTLI